MLVLLIIGGGAVYVTLDRLWERRHEYIRDAIKTAFAEQMPDWQLEFRQARLDDDGRLRIEEVVLVPKGSSAVLLSIPEMVLELDEELLAARHFHVRRIRFERPVVRLVRNSVGVWNLGPLPTMESSGASPEIVIHDGTVLVRLDETEYTPMIEVGCRHVEGGLTPTGWQCYELIGQTNVDHAGALEIAGQFNLLTGKWRIDGAVERLRTAEELFEIAAGFSDEMRSQLHEMANAPPIIRTAELPDDLMGRPTRWDSGNGVPILPASTSPVPAAASQNLGINAVVDVGFALSQDDFDDTVAYSVDLSILSGSIDNNAIPVPLSNLRGNVSLSPEEIVIDHLSASNGNSELLVSGRVSRDPIGPRDLTVKAENLTLGPDLGRFLPPKFAELYNLLSPSGNFDVDVRYNTAAPGIPWTLNEFTARNCRVVHGWFQYPVESVQGTIKQLGDEFHIDMRGVAGRSPVTMTGVVLNPGPEADATFSLSTRQLPVDPPFIMAFVNERWQAMRSAMESLSLRGVADWDVTLVRPPGLDQRWIAKVDGTVTHGSINYERFPLPLNDFAGEVHFDGFTDSVWRFDNLVGKHGNSVITGHGTFTRQELPGLLNLQLTAHNVPLDRDLRLACSVANSEVFDPIWEELSPEGQISLHDMQVLWIPGAGSNLDITLPSILLSDGRMTLRSIPYTWEDVAASGKWDDDRLYIHTLSGWHNDTFLQIDGNSEGAAFVEGGAGQSFDWHVHLEEVALRGLNPNEEFREALPRSLADVFETIDPRGIVDVRLGVDLKGFPSDRHPTRMSDFVTSSWRMTLDFEEVDLNLGIELEKATGRVTFLEGFWDGDKVMTEGWGEFESFEAFDLPFRNVTAPFQIDGSWAVVGNPSWIEQGVTHREDNPQRGKSIESEIYGGELVMDTVVSLSTNNTEQTQYRVDAHLRNAKLERWAADQGHTGRMSGEVFGDVWLAGAGPSRQSIQGAGRIQVMPAALYELPVIVQIFSVANPRQSDRTAFRYAYGEFGIEDGLLNFSQIRMIGNAIALAGEGAVGFAEQNFGRLSLDFKVIPQTQIGIPFVGALFQGIGGEFVTVHVDGTMDQPIATSRGKIPIPVLDDVVQAVMGSLESGSNPMLGPFAPARPLPNLGPTARWDQPGLDR